MALEFKKPFWPNDDFFGIVRADESRRGEFYIWWNHTSTAKVPLLVGLVVGEAAETLEKLEDEEIVTRALGTLRGAFPEEDVSDPIVTKVHA